MSSAVSRPLAASSQEALAHFENLLRFETDCWDVHHAMTNNRQDFVLLDVRASILYEASHIAGAISLPVPKMNQAAL